MSDYFSMTPAELHEEAMKKKAELKVLKQKQAARKAVNDAFKEDFKKAHSLLLRAQEHALEHTSLMDTEMNRNREVSEQLLKEADDYRKALNQRFNDAYDSKLAELMTEYVFDAILLCHTWHAMSWHGIFCFHFACSLRLTRLHPFLFSALDPPIMMLANKTLSPVLLESPITRRFTPRHEETPTKYSKYTCPPFVGLLGV